MSSSEIDLALADRKGESTCADIRCRTSRSRTDPSLCQDENDHAKEWTQKIASFDGVVFVTPEYNHSSYGMLKSAIGHPYRVERQGSRVRLLRLGPRRARPSTCGGSPARSGWPICADRSRSRRSPSSSNLSVFKPGGYNAGGTQTLLEQVIAWSAALSPPRQATIGA
jgi:hypothetical protein